MAFDRIPAYLGCRGEPPRAPDGSVYCTTPAENIQRPLFGTVLAGDGDPNSEPYYGAGLLIGRINTMYDCTVSGTVSSTKNAAGLVGDSNYIHFENCTADVKVNGYNTAGGFVGNAYASEFTDCVAKGNVTSNGWSTGGFAGYAEDNVTIANSIAMGDVKSNANGWKPRTGGMDFLVGLPQRRNAERVLREHHLDQHDRLCF